MSAQDAVQAIGDWVKISMAAADPRKKDMAFETACDQLDLYVQEQINGQKAGAKDDPAIAGSIGRTDVQ
jgi:hypothetical protein